VIEPPAAVASSHATGLLQDIRYAARLLRRQPRHAVLTILTMALGIGATAVLFSVTYGVLIKPLAWPNADRVIVLKETRGGTPPRFGALTNAAYFAWREEARTIDHLAAWSQRLVTVSGAGEPERIRITAATASLFPALGVRPLIGSLFEQKDETSPVIVLSEGLWRQRFGANPAVLGTLIHVDGQPYAVVGVLPDRFSYPDRQSRAWCAQPPATRCRCSTPWRRCARARPSSRPRRKALPVAASRRTPGSPPWRSSAAMVRSPSRQSRCTKR
jgi:hypothetical protein